MMPRVLRRCLGRHLMFTLGLGIVLVMTLAALFAPFIAPYDPTQEHGHAVLMPPCAEFWLGTDRLGRDVFSRLLYGGQASLWVGFVAVGISVSIGTVLGLISGYFRGWVDEIIMRGVDVMLWLAHDGYDYPFEDDYAARYGWLVEGLREIASHRPDVNVTIEYKPADPHIYQYVSTAPKALTICNEVALPNLGIILDYGHALVAGENPAESAALIDRYKRLFHVHLSDCYGKTDDDFLIGSISLWRTIEFFMQLQDLGYDGYYVLDIWPPRMDGIEATKVSVRRTLGLWDIASRLPREEFRRLRRENDVPAIYDLLTTQVLNIP